MAHFFLSIIIVLSLTDCCDKLFEQYLAYMENSTKKKASVWPFQMMLLVLCPVSDVFKAVIKIWTPEKNAVFILKLEERFCHRVMPPTDADGMATVQCRP